MYAALYILQSGADYDHTAMHHEHQIGADYEPPMKIRGDRDRSVYACMNAGCDIRQHGGKL